MQISIYLLQIMSFEKRTNYSNTIPKIRGSIGQSRHHIMLVGVSLSLAYLLAFLTFMNRWINFWLRGSYYLSYQAIFLTLLLILFLVRLNRHQTGTLPTISTIMFGGVAGYGAGLMAFLLHPIFQEDGLHQVLTTL